MCLSFSTLLLITSISTKTSSQFPKLKSLIIFRFFYFILHIQLVIKFFEITFISFLIFIHFLEYGCISLVIFLCLVLLLFRYISHLGVTISSQNVVPISSYYLRIIVCRPESRAWLSSDSIMCDFRQLKFSLCQLTQLKNKN